MSGWEFTGRVLVGIIAVLCVALASEDPHGEILNWSFVGRGLFAALATVLAMWAAFGWVLP